MAKDVDPYIDFDERPEFGEPRRVRRPPRPRRERPR